MLDLRDPQSDYLFIGLGNIGKEYIYTRHNTGFLFIEYLIEQLKLESLISISRDTKEYWLQRYPTLRLSLLKPKTLMNNSGKAVKVFLRYSEIPEENWLLIHDDLDIKLGEYKLQIGKSPKVHNGVRSVEDILGTKDFPRLRIGIDSRSERKKTGSSYVLSRFKKGELNTLHQVFDEIIIRHVRDLLI